MQNIENISLNLEQKVYVIKSGNGYSCLGFEVCEQRCIAIASELASLGYSIPMPAITGTIERYAQLSEMYDQAREHNRKTGYRFHCELCAQLTGLEGKRIEVVTAWDEKKRFWVGKSTGFIPIHLAIARRNCSGGGAAIGPFKSVRIVAN